MPIEIESIRYIVLKRSNSDNITVNSDDDLVYIHVIQRRSIVPKHINLQHKIYMIDSPCSMQSTSFAFDNNKELYYLLFSLAKKTIKAVLENIYGIYVVS